MKHLIIIGAGGFAREVYYHARNSLGYALEWDIKGFLDGDVCLDAQEYDKLPDELLGNVNDYKIDANDVFVCAIAEPKIKEKIVNIILGKGGKFINLIHETAKLEGRISMGVGNIYSPGVTMTDNICIGNFVSFNIGSKVGHDVIIGDFSSFMGDAIVCGFAKLGRRVYMATHSSVMPHSSVGDDVYVGVGSVVMKKVRDGKKVFGNPAMPIE